MDDFESHLFDGQHVLLLSPVSFPEAMVYSEAVYCVFSCMMPGQMSTLRSPLGSVGAGAWRDAVRSTKKKAVYAWGLNLVVMIPQVQAPWGGDPLDDRLAEERGVSLIAPHRGNRSKEPTQDGRALRRYRKRWKVERLFAWFQNFRRLVVRYEYHLQNFLGMVQLGCIIILLRRVLG